MYIFVYTCSLAEAARPKLEPQTLRLQRKLKTPKSQTPASRTLNIHTPHYGVEALFPLSCPCSFPCDSPFL